MSLVRFRASSIQKAGRHFENEQNYGKFWREDRLDGGFRRKVARITIDPILYLDRHI